MITLLGSTGYIGSAFKEEIVKRGIPLHCPMRSTYSNFDSFVAHIQSSYGIGLVINAAAFVTKPSVDLCEDHKGETLMGNLVLPTTIANVCQALELPLIHVSTGCLFNGDNGGRGYNEDSLAQLTFDTGCGFYVGSKQLAEQAVKQWAQSYICRIRIPFDNADNERNYLSKLQRYPKVYNGRNSLAHRGDFVKACLDLWEKRAPYGTYNVVNTGSVSAQECCIMIRRILKPDRTFEYWDEAEFMTKVARTMKSNCILDTSKLLSTGVKMRSVWEAVEDSLRNWLPEKPPSA